ncbi:phosphoglycerate kinase [Patescibacteria group bacterium]|nr:phosphoglycerate kinase [Patescibacteria group bacterium]
MKLKTIKQVKNLKNKKVLLRVGFDTPLDEKGMIIDDFRIKQGLETIKYLLAKGAGIILINKMGRPKGKVVAKLSNKAVAKRLSQLLKVKVIQLPKVVGFKNSVIIKNLKKGQIVMLENVRFHHGEQSNDKNFAKQLAGLGDIYVNDAFSVCHREAASITAITDYLPAYAGLLLAKEVEILSQVLKSKVKPKIAIIGGAKLETKVKVIKNLLKKTDQVLLGGAVANNFIKARGYNIGKSLYDKDYLSQAKKMLGQKLIIPQDVVTTTSISTKISIQVKQLDKINKNDYILDIGPKTINNYFKFLKKARIVIWNGPLGYFEIKEFKKASEKISRFLAQSSAKTIIGGGETIQLVNDLALSKKFTFISTGGGAMLEFLEGKVLPGLKPLIRN